MTFIRKILDILNMDNWNNDNNLCIESKIKPKWLSVRNPDEMEKEEDNISLKEVTIFFENGMISDVVPDVYNYYYAQFYIIDKRKYDTYSIDSVNKIPVPNYDKSKVMGTPVYNLEYLLNIRASQERKKGNNGLAYALLRRSIYLMKFSKVGYGEKNFLRIVNWLYEDGYYYEAENTENQLRKELPLVFNRTMQRRELFQKVLEDCKKINTDYVFCSPHQGTCPECAKYQCRVYCISGRDKRLPKLPDIVKEYGGFHEGCIHSFSPHYLKVNDTIRDYNLKEYNVFIHSNRPFVDDRTLSDKQSYDERLKNQLKREQANKNKKNYYLLKKYFPNDVPKSLSGFTRMRNANSAKYKEIRDKAKQIGIEL